ncbi:MAG: N-acetylmuramoyl-L-alanine amidase, partial [Peptococcaceae bacterium]
MEKRNYRKNPLRIFIAVGHGGPDPGAVNERLGLREADCNLALALQLRSDLKRHGVQVMLSRYKDEKDRLSEEIAQCNAYQPDFAIALHTNSSANGQGSGFEVYHQTAPWEHCQFSVRMATLFDRNVARYLGVKTRGLKTSQNLGWLKQVQAPCILVESYFINGPRADWYSSVERTLLFSQAYTRAILEFYGIPYQENKLITLRFQMITDDLRTAKSCACQAILVDGHYFIHMRQLFQLLGKAIYYDDGQKMPIVYPPEYYAESDFQSGLLKRSDFPSQTEQLLAGIPM